MIDHSVGPAPASRAITDTPIVAGIGARGAATSDEVLALLDRALARALHSRADLVALVTLDKKAAHPALQQAAQMLGLPLVPVPEADMQRAVANPSSRVAHYLGLPSVAEAAAFAFGPPLLEKQRGANVTCALALYAPDPASMPSAASAASTLSTSSAGP